MGSRILSRSFQVEAQPRTDGTHALALGHEDAEMDLDDSSLIPHGSGNTENIEDDSGSDGDDDDDPANVAMVPMADMLNARYGCANVSVRLAPLLYPLGLTNYTNPSRLNFFTKSEISEWSRRDPFVRANKS